MQLYSFCGKSTGCVGVMHKPNPVRGCPIRAISMCEYHQHQQVLRMYSADAHARHLRSSLEKYRMGTQVVKDDFASVVRMLDSLEAATWANKEQLSPACFMIMLLLLYGTRTLLHC
jgi:hypothetical protein